MTGRYAPPTDEVKIKQLFTELHVKNYENRLLIPE